MEKSEELKQIENEPKIDIEYNCPVEELAEFISNARAEDGKDRRIQFTLKQARERVQDFISRPNATEVILRKDGAIIGCAFSYEQSREDFEKEVPHADFFTKEDARVFKIREVNVAPQHRNHGFGQIIMEKIMLESKQRGATKLVLKSSAERRFYEKLGFKEVAPDQDPLNFYMEYDFPPEDSENK